MGPEEFGAKRSEVWIGMGPTMVVVYQGQCPGQGKGKGGSHYFD